MRPLFARTFQFVEFPQSEQKLQQIHDDSYPQAELNRSASIWLSGMHKLKYTGAISRLIQNSTITNETDLNSWLAQIETADGEGCSPKQIIEILQNTTELVCFILYMFVYFYFYACM